MGNYCSISLIENQKQFGTSEAMAVSKKLGVSSFHATKSSTNFAWWAKIWTGLLPSLLMCEKSKERKDWRWRRVPSMTLITAGGARESQVRALQTWSIDKRYI